MPCLLSLAKEATLAVRRFGTAGLGEALFFVCTKPDGSGWTVQGDTVGYILHCLRKEEDEGVRLAALRTYENVLCAAQPQWARRFATREVAAMLMSHIEKPYSDEIRSIASMALYHLVRSNRRVFPELSERKVSMSLSLGKYWA